MNQWMTYYKELLTEDRIQFMEKETSEVHQEEFIQEVPDITPQEIREALKNMKKGKAPGSGNISVKLLKAAPDILMEILAYIFNRCLYGEETRNSNRVETANHKLNIQKRK